MSPTPEEREQLQPEPSEPDPMLEALEARVDELDRRLEEEEGNREDDFDGELYEAIKGPIVDEVVAPWDAEGQEILERAAQRISGLAAIAMTTEDVEEELLIEEVEVLELLVERGKAALLGPEPDDSES